jgi:hypothetical protein
MGDELTIIQDTSIDAPMKEIRQLPDPFSHALHRVRCVVPVSLCLFRINQSKEFRERVRLPRRGKLNFEANFIRLTTVVNVNTYCS